MGEADLRLAETRTQMALLVAIPAWLVVEVDGLLALVGVLA